jgi:hypothetical protein
MLRILHFRGWGFRKPNPSGLFFTRNSVFGLAGQSRTTHIQLDRDNKDGARHFWQLFVSWYFCHLVVFAAFAWDYFPTSLSTQTSKRYLNE